MNAADADLLAQMPVSRPDRGATWRRGKHAADDIPLTGADAPFSDTREERLKVFARFSAAQSQLYVMGARRTALLC
jgi:hypothetical protein